MVVESSKFNPQRTERLLLDSFNLREAQQFFNMASTYEVAKYLSGVYVQSLEQAYENIIYYQNQNGNGDFYIAIRLWTLKEKGTLVGTIIATRPREENESKTLEIAYLIGEKYRGNGYIEEAMKCFISIAKGIGYQLLKLEIIEDNECSKKIAKKLGAVFIKKIENKTNLYVLNLNQI